MMDLVMLAREARPADAPAMGTVHVRAWRAAYRGLMPARYLDGLSAEERAIMWERSLGRSRDRARVIVAERDRVVVGFAAIGPARDNTTAEEAAGELYSLNVDPDHWGIGAGRLLISAVHRDLTDLGFTDALLWVHPENQRARDFYVRAGWTCDEARREQDVLGVVVPELRYRRDLFNQPTSLPLSGSLPHG